MILYDLAISTTDFIFANRPIDRVSRFDREIINQLATTLIAHYNKPRGPNPVQKKFISHQKKLSITFLKPESWDYIEAQIKNTKTPEGHVSYWRYWLNNIHEIKKLNARISGTEKLQEQYRTENPFSAHLYDNEASELLEEEVNRLENEIKSFKQQAQKIIKDLEERLYSFAPVTKDEEVLTADLMANWVNLSSFSFPKPTISNSHAPSEERRSISIEEERNGTTLDYNRLIRSGADAVFIMKEESSYTEKSINGVEAIKTKRIMIDKEYLNNGRLGTRTERVCFIMIEALRLVNKELDPEKDSFFDTAFDTIKEWLFLTTTHTPEYS